MRGCTISAEESLRCSPGFCRVVRPLQRGLGVEKSLGDESSGRRRVVYKNASCPGCFLSFLYFSTQPLHKNSTVSFLVFCPLCSLSSVLCPLSSTARRSAHHRPYSEPCRCHCPVTRTPSPLSLGVRTTCALAHYKHSHLWPSTVQRLVNASSLSIA